MIKQILTAADIPAQPGRFPDPPAASYAIYFDDVEVEGPDPVLGVMPRIYHHDCTVELYELTQDDAVEAALEAELLARGLSWTKQARYWLVSIQRYQVIYEFSYTSKS